MSGDSGAGSPAAVGFWEVLAFCCELAMLAALAISGWLLAPSLQVAIALAFGLPALTGLVWGLWLAPRARRRLHGPSLTAAKLVVFVATGVALAVAGQGGWGAALTTVSVIDALMISRRPGRWAPR